MSKIAPTQIAPTQSVKFVVVVCGVALSLTAPSSSSTPVTTPNPEVPVLTWQPCTNPTQTGFQCATVKVPLDYRNPDADSIQLAVIKHPATDQNQRIGSLLMNPGGPGGAGTEALPAWLSLFPKQVQDRFDIISFDPRGIGESTAVQCSSTEAEQNQFFTNLPQGFPVGLTQTTAWIEGYRQFAQLCEQHSGKLLSHVSTTEVAKDLDLLRRAVGESQINYLGLSYGTYLGAVYANLFPDNVRAMVLDGNIDPLVWTNRNSDDARLSLSLRIGTDKGTAKTLNAFLDLCGQTSTDRCAFSAGSAEATRTKFATLLQRLQQQPVNLDGKTITYAVVVAAISDDLFVVQEVGGFRGWQKAGQFLQQVWTAPPLAALNPATVPLIPPDQGQFAVACAEASNPRDPNYYRQLATLAFDRAGDVGPYWSWGDQPCSTWPATAAERYSGPWNRPTANPILVVGNTYDPSTPYENSVAMARTLAQAQLLTVDGYGHTALLNPSQCANDHIATYFIQGTLPPDGTVCQQDQFPFSSSSAQSNN